MRSPCQLDGLRALIDALGRVEQAERKRGQAERGREEVTGVHFDGEPAFALPSELALLADPDTEDLFYQRVADHRLLSLELAGAGIAGDFQGTRKGPVIACIDTSGSMNGPPELAAKALVLALCKRMLPAGRAVHLLLFGGVEEVTELRLRRGQGGLEALLDFLALRFDGGTDFDTPLLRAMTLLESRALQEADVLVVTDGLASASTHVVARVLDVRARTGARVWSLVLARHDSTGVAAFSHAVYVLDPTDAAAAAGFVREFTRTR